ncbi:MAG: hypothetical protein ACFFC9_12430 [Promethearchaeota archaeon]
MVEMTEIYHDFMVYELEDTGERRRLSITESEFREENGNGILHPEQVAIIVKEELRRIYIWKGVQSPVRKKFIASRVASDLQNELYKLGNFHRCKVVSVDQGEEPLEFLNAFGFKRDELLKKVETAPPHIISNNNYTESISNHQVKESVKIQETPKKKEFIKPKEIPKKSLAYNELKNEKNLRKTLDKILQIDIPKGFKRKNILVGNNILYGIITKKVNIFGEIIEEKDWEPVSNLAKDTFELEGHKLRIHFNNEIGKIEAIEILEEDGKIKPKIEQKDKESKEINYSKWTVKQLKSFCSQNSINVPSSYRKAEIVRLVEDFTKGK